MLIEILTLDHLQWLPNRKDFLEFLDLDTHLVLYQKTSGFHGAFATGVTSLLCPPSTCVCMCAVNSGGCITGLQQLFIVPGHRNKTNHPISSNSHSSATANKSNHSLKQTHIIRPFPPVPLVYAHVVITEVFHISNHLGVFQLLHCKNNA